MDTDILNITDNLILYSSFKSSGKIKDVMSTTVFLDKAYDKVYFKQRIWHIKNGIYDIIMCTVCSKNPAKFHKSHGYTCCSKICTNMKIKESVEK